MMSCFRPGGKTRFISFLSIFIIIVVLNSYSLFRLISHFIGEFPIIFADFL